MKNYSLPLYDPQREWILTERQTGTAWEKIQYGKKNNEAGLELFLSVMKEFSHWNEELTLEDWYTIVDLEKRGEEERLSISYAERSSIIGESSSVNNIKIPTGRYSCWQKYRQYLLDEQGFLKADVDAIQSSTRRILQRMNSDTYGVPVKGLVVGNVQSGKTANMAGLMAMAADYGWNMFIVLSGTIENLRIQTLERLVNDLNRSGCTMTWNGIARPSKNCPVEDRAQVLNFDTHSHNRYLTVCLKNSKRLKDLIEWLSADPKTSRKMKVLIIDDESDQASVNTKSIDRDERTKINNLIVNMVENRTADGKSVDWTYGAMNYIGYTATPYANVLNEGWDDSLYPRDFISTLQVSKTYFGPQQIFGDRTNNTDYVGLDIVREISLDESKYVKKIHDGKESLVPQELEKAICWFLCCVAARRVQHSNKPVSMLIHTSQKQKHHDAIADAIANWYRYEAGELISKCKDVWKEETTRFDRQDLYDNYDGFAVDNSELMDYPEFSEMLPYLKVLLDSGLTNIKLGDEGDLTYNKGIHLCIDNCRNNGVQDDGTYLRLAYPKKSDELNYASAFIVIGGATLSRGLTIEGLVSTYFLRSTKLGDTLMQMGRWFGYRRGYELLQRIWITENATRQFEFLADLDSDLRAYITQMELFDKSPKDYAVLIKQSPSSRLLTITSKNKMQGAKAASVNYSGFRAQTHLLIEDDTSLKENYRIAEAFALSLGNGAEGKGLGSSSYIWKGIEFDHIHEKLLKPFQFHNHIVTFGQIDAVKEWVNDMTARGHLDKWNVILFGVESGEKTTFAGHTVGMVQRTRKTVRPGENTIDLKIITDPKEKVADVDPQQITDSIVLEKYKKYKTKYEMDIRNAAGLGKTPTLVIYIIDKDSKKFKDRDDEHDLNTCCNVVGISMNIPGDRINDSYTSSISLDLEKFNLGADIEGADNED